MTLGGTVEVLRQHLLGVGVAQVDVDAAVATLLQAYALGRAEQAWDDAMQVRMYARVQRALHPTQGGTK